MITTIVIVIAQANLVTNVLTNVGMRPVIKQLMKHIAIKEMIEMSIGTTLLRSLKILSKALRKNSTLLNSAALNMFILIHAT